MSSTAYDRKAYQTPSLDLLAPEEPRCRATGTSENIAVKLDTMFRQLDMDAHVSAFHRGPTVTQYEVEVGPGVKIDDVMDLRRNIVYTAATLHVRMFSPIPGKSAISIEIPNAVPETVYLGDVLRSKEMADDANPTLVPIGKDFEGRIVMADLMTLPHLLIGGMQDSGKSSFINAMLTTVLMRATPDQVRILLIDTTRTEFSAYGGVHRVPHLLTPVITDPQKAVRALEWVTKDIDARYADHQHNRHLNRAILRGQLQAPDGTAHKVDVHPTIIVVVNDPADLLLGAGNGADDAIRRISQLGAGADVHLVFSTIQPLSTQLLSATTKANCPARLSFAMHTGFESRANLGYGGADALIGQGDALFSPTPMAYPTRIQTPWIGETEIRKVIARVRTQPRPPYPTADAILRTL